MNDSRSCVEDFRCYEQPRALYDMNYAYTFILVENQPKSYDTEP